MVGIPGSRGNIRSPGGLGVQNDIYDLQVKLNTIQQTTAFPVNGIINSYLSAADIARYFDSTGKGIKGSYINWAICNGSNGTPNLASKFIRESVTAAGSTGGSDSSAHTHDINHTHGAGTSGNESAHTHAAGTLCANLNAWANTLLFDKFTTVTEWEADIKIEGTWSSSDPAQTNTSGVIVGGSTAAGSSHNHSTPALTLGVTASGAASATDNRPAYYELVPLMRIV